MYTLSPPDAITRSFLPRQYRKEFEQDAAVSAFLTKWNPALHSLFKVRDAACVLALLRPFRTPTPTPAPPEICGLRAQLRGSAIRE